MKNLFSILFLFIVFHVGAQIPTNGLIAYYPFNSNANDASGNNNNPVFNNATLTTDRLGNANSAYHFNGVNNYIQVPNSATLNTSNQISLCVWVRPMAFYAGACHGNSILMKGDQYNLPGNYSLIFSDAIFTTTNCSSPVDTSHQNFYGIDVTPPRPGYTPYIQTNQWYNVIVTCNGTTANLYINSVLKGSAQQNSTSYTNLYDLFLGRLNNATFPYWFNGDLDEVRIYNRAITQQEVTTIYTSTPACIPPTISSVTNNSRCATGIVSLTAATSTGNTIDWYAAATAGTALSSGTTIFTTPSIAATTIYYAEARNTLSGCVSLTRTAVTASINPIPIAPTILSGSRCGTGTVSLTATAPVGSALDWYAAATGGIALASNAITFSTPSISVTTIYYVESRNTITGCVSATRTAITATINAIPLNPTVTNVSRCGTGTVSLTAASLGAVIDWYATSTSTVLLATGVATYLTPIITATTIYYTGGRNATTGCISTGRTAITATVNSTPALPAGIGGSRCGTGAVILSSTAGAGATTDWYSVATVGTVLVGGTGVASFTTPSILATTNYYAQSRNTTTGCVSLTRTIVAATVNANPAVSIGTSAARCGPGTVALSAAAIAGTTIDWYSTATLGTAIAVGTVSYTTPVISATTNYYAQARNTTTGCVSATRTILTATINAIPLNPTVTDVSRCGTGTVSLTAASLGAVIDWYATSTSTVLLATGVATYLTPSITATTIYYTGGRNATTGCISTGRTAITATVNSTPAFPAGIGGSRCGTGTVILSSTAGAGETIDWYSVATVGTALASSVLSYSTPSIALTTTYYAEARNTTTGCISSARTAIIATINALPAILTGNGTSRCGTGSVALSAVATAGNTIDWYSAATAGTALGTGIATFTTPSLSTTTTYYAQARNTTTGCLSSTRLAVIATINALPAAPVGTGNPRCGSGTVSLSATAVLSNTVDWFSTATGGIALASSTTTFVTPNIATTTIYYAEGRNITTGCLSATRSSVTATVISTPAAPIGVGGERCAPGIVNISATTAAGSTIDWYSSSTAGNPLVSTAANFTTPAISTNTTYYAEARNTTAGCISATRTAVIATVSPVPVAGFISAPDNVMAFCSSGFYLTLSGSLGSVQWQEAYYAFNDGITTYELYYDITGANDTIVQPSGSGFVHYRVIVSSGSCTSVITEPIMIYIDDIPNTDIIFTDPTCFGACNGTAGIINNNTNMINIISWYKDGQYYSNPWNIDNLCPGFYEVYVEENCGSDYHSFTITESTTALTNPTFNSISPLCKGTTAPSLPTTSTNNITGSWSPNAISTSAAGTSNYLFTPNPGQCAATISVPVTINSFNPNLFSQDTIRACGTLYVLNAASGYSSYSWNTGASTASVNVTSTGWYKCTTSNGTCSGSDSVFISIVNANIINNDTTICMGANITLNAIASSSVLTYLWSNGATTLSISVAPGVTTTYYCTINNGVSSCTDSVKVTVTSGTTPSTPGNIIGASDVCSSYTGTNSVSSSVRYYINKVSNASSYQWTLPTGCNLISGQGDTAILVTFNSSFISGAISVVAINLCGNLSSSKSLTVYKRVAATPAAIQKEFSPTSIAATTSVCGLSSEIYRILKVNYATSYNWSLINGTKATITHINGAGINDTAVLVTFLSGFAKDSLSVISVTPCSSSAAKFVALNATLAPPTVTTLTATGNNFSPCIGDIVTYTASATIPTTSQSSIAMYRWTIPSYTAIQSAVTDSSSITLKYNIGFTGGSISAKGQSGCGIVGVAKTVILQYLPPTPTSITSSTGLYNACIGNIITYTVFVPAPSTSQRVASVYRWTKPNNTTITSAVADSSNITLLFNTGYTGGTLTVKGQTLCGVAGAAISQPLTHLTCATGTKINPYATTVDKLVFDVKLFPNPTTSNFNLQISSSAKDPVSVKISDIQGRLIKSIFVLPSEINVIGNNFKTGVYLLEVRQGNLNKTIRAVKF